MSSNKNALLKKSKRQEPRALDEIRKQYNELRGKVADAQYNAFVYNLEAENLNKMLLNLNQEASERQKLDATTKTDEVANVQS